LISINYYDGKSSRGESGYLSLGADGKLQLHVHEGYTGYSLKDVRISDRLGATPRIFEFPDGGRAETIDNDAVDHMLRGSGELSWVHRLEVNRYAVLASVVGLVFLVWGMVQFGVPWAAERLAHAVPPTADKTISEQTLAALDNALLDPSALSEARRTVLRQRFGQLAESVSDRHDYQLVFRSSPKLGPNAFALPSGTIVLFDELVALAKNDDEVLSVLAHEIGHVKARHGLRGVLQDSAVVLVIGVVTGDVLSSSSFAALLPVLLAETRYSREFEV